MDKLIFIKYIGNAKAKVKFLKKNKIDNSWIKLLECDGYIGKNGLGKAREGDLKTPKGIFNIRNAFGIKKNPGTSINYINITEDIYACNDSKYYNQIINIKEKNHYNCKGEHMIEYMPEYNYGMEIDYNKNNIVGRGSSIFIHCIGNKKYTEGCIAITEEDMIYILKNCNINTKVLII